jgi:hypothetical protein
VTILFSPPKGLFIYQNQQYTLPFRYAYDPIDLELKDFKTGVPQGIFIYPRVSSTQTGTSIELDGTLLYLNERTVLSQLARLYLYQEDNEYFTLVHSEDDFVVSQIKTQNPGFDKDIINFQGLRGPIRIWEISYSDDIEFKPEFIDTNYPEELRRVG